MDDFMSKDYSSFSNNIIFDSDNDERENTFIGDKHKKQKCCKKIGNLLILLKVGKKYLLSIGPDCKFISLNILISIRHILLYSIHYTYRHSTALSFISVR